MSWIADITILSNTSGYAPFTVTVSSENSNLNGNSSQDVEFLWDFGDPSPPLNGNQDNERYYSNPAGYQDLDITSTTTNQLVTGNFKNKTRFPIPTIDSDVDNTGYTKCSGLSNSMQRGKYAAYTYYHNNGGSPFTVTLRIFFGGVEVASTTATVAVSQPTVYNSWTNAEITNPLHAINQDGSYVSLKINPSYNGVGQDDPGNSECNSFATLANAVAWANNWHSNGVRYVLTNANGVYSFDISAPITFDGNDQVITVSDYQYLSHFSLVADYNPGVEENLIVFKGSRIHMENITVKGYGPTSSSELVGIFIHPSQEQFCLHNCSFSGLKVGVWVMGAKGYINRIICPVSGSDYLFKESLIKGTGAGHLILTNLEVSSFSGSTRTLYEKQGKIVDITNSNGVILQWSYLDNALTLEPGYSSPGGDSSAYGFLYNTFDELSAGAFRFATGAEFHVYSNCFVRGCSDVLNSFYIRIAGNYFSGAGGGQKSNPSTIIQKRACLHLDQQLGGVAVVSNVFELKYNNMLCSGILVEPTVIKQQVSIYNNMFLLWSNIANESAVCDLGADNYVLEDFHFSYNTFVDNKINCMSNYIRYNTTQTASNIKYNVYPKPEGLENVRMAIINGVQLDSLTFYPSNEATSFAIEIEDCLPERAFALDVLKYEGFEKNLPLESINRNYRLELLDSSILQRVCAASFVAFSDDSSQFSVSSSLSYRSRPTNINAVTNDSHNLTFEIRDPSFIEQDDDGVTSAKMIVGQSFGRPSYEVAASSYLSLLNGVGDYIKTTISTSVEADGIDITVVYTNDGPLSQVVGSAAQKMGTIDIDGIFCGRSVSLLTDLNGMGFYSYMFHAKQGLYTGNDAREYPYKFAPISCYLLKNHAVVVSWTADYINSDKMFQEITSSRSGFNGIVYSRGKTQLKWLANSGSSISYYNDCLQRGESFSITISVRIARNPSKWVLKTKPWKDYLQSNHEMVHTRDPRPVFLEVMTTNPGAAPLLLNASYNIPSTGYSSYINNVVSNVINKNYQRYMVWEILGHNENGLNYYPQILTPIYRNQYPWNGYPNMLSSISGLQRLGEEIAQFGFYQGYADLVATSSTVYGPSVEYDTIDFTDTARMQKFYDEVDLASDLFWANSLGLDFFGSSFNQNQMKNALDLMDTYKERYPNMSLLGEKAKQDVFCFRGASYLFSYDGICGPHHLANFLVPGNEHWCIDYGVVRFDSALVEEEIIYRLEAMASYGYVVGGYGLNVYPNLNPLSSSLEAVDRRFDFAEVPANYTSTVAPAPPSNLRYGFYDKERNTTYSTDRKYIKIFWDANEDPDFSHYIVYKCKISNQVIDSTPANFVKRQYTKNPFFYDTAVRTNSTYYYQVSAVDVFGNESNKSSILTVPFVPDDPVLEPPSSVTAVGDVDQNTITISWSS